MYRVCMNCYEVYKHYKEISQICPKAMCNGVTVEIDELLIPVIINLNQKGYKTDMCCSGHEFGITEEDVNYKAYGTGYEMWIHFSREIFSLPNLPKGFEICPLGNKHNAPVLRIEQTPADWNLITTADRMSHRFKGIVNLMRWAEELNDISGDNDITFADIYKIIEDINLEDRGLLDLGRNVELHFGEECNEEEDEEGEGEEDRTNNSFKSYMDVVMNDKTIIMISFDPGFGSTISARVRIIHDDKVPSEHVFSINKNLQQILKVIDNEDQAKFLIGVLREFRNRYEYPQ